MMDHAVQFQQVFSLPDFFSKNVTSMRHREVLSERHHPENLISPRLVISSIVYLLIIEYYFSLLAAQAKLLILVAY